MSIIFGNKESVLILVVTNRSRHELVIDRQTTAHAHQDCRGSMAEQKVEEQLGKMSVSNSKKA